MDVAQVRPGDLVLDLGPGRGAVLLPAAHRGWPKWLWNWYRHRHRNAGVHPLHGSEERQLVSGWHPFGNKDVPGVRLQAKHVDPQLLAQALAQQSIHLRP